MTGPQRTIEWLDQLEELGLTDESFGLLHHLTRKGTKSETIRGMRRYCETLKVDFRPDESNDRLRRRLEFVLHGYRKFDLPPGNTTVFDALAKAAYLGIPPFEPGV
jgi:hypothetical protein